MGQGMAVTAKADEIFHRIGATLSPWDHVVNLEVLGRITQGATVTVAPVDLEPGFFGDVSRDHLPVPPFLQ